ncbi:MAG: cupin domain-containing protein [Candidatus Omnitrophota bacterium]|jgi:quercetin dioxygenase-like cupin family protein
MENSRQSTEKLTGQILDPAGMIAYQEASIVSRTLLTKKAGTVTLFAFDKGQSLSEHTSPYDAIVQGVEGRGEILIAGKPHALHKGEMIILPAQVPHAVKAPAKFKMMLVMIRS